MVTAEKRGLTGTWLKYFACLSMLVDHFAAAFCPAGSFYTILLRGFGRLAFPIFAFFVAEGCRKTRSLPDYGRRLFLFALLTQLPFSYYFQRWSGSIVMTFFLAAAAASFYESCREHWPAPVSVLPGLLMAMMAYWMDTDYGYMGVLIVFALYLCQDNRTAKLVVLVVGLFLFYQSIFFLFALLALPLLLCYNGTRGSGNKWFFYWFYPLHLLALSLIYYVRYLL